MKHSSEPLEKPGQQNTEASGEREERYSLEDIMREFGGWTKDESPAEKPAEGPAAPPEEEPQSAEPAVEPEQPAPVETPPQKPSRFRFINLEQALTEEPEAEEPETAEPAEEPPKIWTYHGEEREEPTLHHAKLRRVKPEPAEPETASSRGRRPRPKKEPEPEPVGPSPEEAYQTACRRGKGLFLRRRLMGILCLLALAATACGHFHVNFGGFLMTDLLASQILLGIHLAGVLLAYDVLVSGVSHLLRLRPNLESLLLVQAVVFLTDGFAALPEERLPCSAVLLLGLYFALWGRTLENRSRRRSLKTVIPMGENPSAAVFVRHAWDDASCVFRAEGRRDRYTAQLDAPSAVDRVMSVYAPLVLVLSLALALVFHFTGRCDFLGGWTAMLAGSVPVASFLTFWRPFSGLAARLQRSGTALCGWQGARKLAEKCCITVTDRDLFSQTNVTMNGMKVFGTYNVSQVVGYAYAVIAESGCGLEPAFHETFVNQNGRSCVISDFRRYEGGGLGAEIQGDVVLVGSIGFMQLMGVRMPEGTNVRQAVYCAVNGVLAAVFAIHYNPSGPVKSGLSGVLRSKGLRLLLATRDFILTPAAVHHKFKIPSGSMEYPSVEERTRLSSPEASADGVQTALLSHDTFLPLAEAVTGGRSLCHSVYAGLSVNLLGGILGFGLSAFLVFLGSLTTASAFNLTLFVLIWTLPAFLLTSIAGK